MNPLDRLKEAQRQQREAGSGGKAESAKPIASPLEALKAKQLEQRNTSQAQAPQPAQAVAVKAVAVQSAEVQEGVRLQAEVAFSEAQVRLQVLEDIGKKAVVKREYLPQLAPYVAYYFASGAHYPNAVAVHAAIWALDVGDIENGLAWGLALIEQGQDCPARFQSSLPTVICRGVYEWAADKLRSDQPAAPYLDQIITAIEAHGWELNPLVGSMMYAMRAKHADRLEDWQTAYDACQKAMVINPEKHGVKTLLEKVAKKLGLAV